MDDINKTVAESRRRVELWLESLERIENTLEVERLKAQDDLDNILAGYVAPDMFEEVKSLIEQQKQARSAKTAKLREEMAGLEGQIKAEIANLGETVKAAGYMAVYNAPRVSWDTKMLEGMRALLPQLDKARKVAKKGSCSIRRGGAF